MFGFKNYIYCSVTFDGTKTYYYRTSDAKIRPGDKVIVPVGKINAQKIGFVVAVETYKRKTVPYPVRKTKQIISLAGKNSERKVERYNRKLLKRIEKERRLENQKKIDKLAAEHKKRLELEWIDRIEELDALLND